MTKQELLALINQRVSEDAEFAQLVLNRNDTAIAAALSEGRTRVESKVGGIGLVLDTLGPEQGAQVLDALELVKASNRAVYWGWTLLERGELDFGLASTRAMIDMLVGAGVISQAHGDALKATAEVPEEIDIHLLSNLLSERSDA